MQCPNGDGELLTHITHGENNLTVTYSTCAVCHGYWMSSFAANFIKASRSEETHTYIPRTTLFCPVCQIHLAAATGENIPETVRVYTCPNHHGYFFPSGELAKFKQAQTTKIAYHKLWNLPLPSVASVLLATFAVVILTGGGFAAYNALQTQQGTSLQARQLVTDHHEYIVRETHEVLLVAQTSADAVLTVQISPAIPVQQIQNDNPKLHQFIVKNVAPGAYHYHFTMTIAGKAVLSDTYTFVMP